MRILFIFMIFVLSMSVFSACVNYDYRIDSKMEQRLLSGRKAQINEGNRTRVLCIATYLNNVAPDVYNGGEYFFLEVFSEEEIPLGFMDFNITDNAQMRWIREISVSEFDENIGVYNKWSKGYLMAFDEISENLKKHMKLELSVENFGKMSFDFSYKVFEMQF